MTEGEMVAWHHRLDGHEFEQALGVGDGQGGLACCSLWDGKGSDMTERLNWLKSVCMSGLVLGHGVIGIPYYLGMKCNSCFCCVIAQSCLTLLRPHGL